MAGPTGKVVADPTGNVVAGPTGKVTTPSNCWGIGTARIVTADERRTMVENRIAGLYLNNRIKYNWSLLVQRSELESISDVRRLEYG